MSYKKKNRSSGAIGCNIRKGQIPGGMAMPIACSGKNRKRRTRTSMQQIKAAADASLMRLGFVAQLPSQFERSVIPVPKETGIPP